MILTVNDLVGSSKLNQGIRQPNEEQSQLQYVRLDPSSPFDIQAAKSEGRQALHILIPQFGVWIDDAEWRRFEFCGDS